MGRSKNAQAILKAAPHPQPGPTPACGAHVSGSSRFVLAAVPYLSRKALHQRGGLRQNQTPTTSSRGSRCNAFPDPRLGCACPRLQFTSSSLRGDAGPHPETQYPLAQQASVNTLLPNPCSDRSTRPGCSHGRAPRRKHFTPPRGSLPVHPHPAVHGTQQTVKPTPSGDWELQHQVQFPWKASVVQPTL